MKNLISNIQKKDTVLLETNVLLYDTESIKKFKNKTVLIPLIVIDELDLLKDDFRKAELSQASKEVTRVLLEIIGESNIKNIRKGVTFESMLGGETELIIIDEHDLFNYERLNNPTIKKPITKDDWLIFCTKLLNSRLITRSTNMILKASGFCEVELYRADSIKQKEVYKGYKKLSVNQEFIDSFVSNGSIPNFSELFDDNKELHQNEFLILENELMPEHKVFGICKGFKIIRIDLDNMKYNGMVLRPLGISQKLAFYLLLDDSISAVTFLGGSGTGKTSISIDYALNQVNKRNYNQLYYAKSLKGLDGDEDYGFVPGDVDEKMQGAVVPLTCTLEVLENKRQYKSKNREKNYDEIQQQSGELLLEKYKEDGTIRILPLNYLRGMTITSKIVILDEGQNLTIHKMKTLATRISDSSKLIITGDDNQIDDKNLNRYNNGLAHFIEKGKDEPFIAHLTLDLDGNESKRGKLSNFGNTL